MVAVLNMFRWVIFIDEIFSIPASLVLSLSQIFSTGVIAIIVLSLLNKQPDLNLASDV